MYNLSTPNQELIFPSIYSKIRDFSAFLKAYQLSDMLIHNPLNTVIFSCSVEGMVLEGGAEGRRQWRVDFATFHQACSHLIGCHGT